MGHHGDDVCGGCCVGILFCSYLRKPTGQEFFIPAQTLNWGKAVKSIDGLNSCSLVCIASLYLVGCSQQQWMT